MYNSLNIFSAAAALLLIPSAIAQGFTVVNNCQATVFYKLTNQGGDYGAGEITTGNSFGYIDWGAANDGTSVKMDWWGTFSDTNTFQFEVVQASDSTVWYDLSAENGDPMQGVTRTVEPNYDSTASGCQVIYCGYDTEDCEYQQGNYNWNPNYACAPEGDGGEPLYLTLYLCE